MLLIGAFLNFIREQSLRSNEHDISPDYNNKQASVYIIS